MGKVLKKKEFEEFYRRRIDQVYRFVFFRTGRHKELAEDLVAEIFMKVLEHWEQYDPERSQSAWLMTIAKNHLANYWRDHRSTSALPESEAGEDEGPGDQFWLKGALKQWQKGTNQLAVAELLLNLEQGEQEIVTFHYLFGYSYAEIAALKGLTAGAVKVASHRAIKKLRKFL